jgi:hypothetical protein
MTHNRHIAGRSSGTKSPIRAATLSLILDNIAAQDDFGDRVFFKLNILGVHETMHALVG